MLVSWFEGPPFKFKHGMKEHTRFVTCVRFSPDGNRLVTVSTDKTGFIYDGKSGEIIGKLNPDQGHTAGIYSCCWSPDSKFILTASADKTCKIWDADNGNCVKTFTIPGTGGVEDQQLGCLWQGKDLLSVSLSGDVFYLDPDNTSKPKRILRGHQKFITALAHHPGQKAIYTGSYDALIVKWDIASGETEGLTGKGHTNQINKMFVQGDNLVSCAMDDTVRITPLSSRTYSAEAVGLDSTPADIAVGKKDLVVAVTVNSIVMIRGGKITNKHAVKFQPAAVALSVDETVVAVGGKDNKIYLFSLSGDKLSEGPVLEGHRGPLSVLSYSPDGKWLASADHNREIIVWNTGTNKIHIQGWVFHTARVNSLAWSPDSLHLVSGSLDCNLYVWSVADSSKRIQIKDAHRGGVNSALWLDNTSVVSAGQDCTVKTWKITHH